MIQNDINEVIHHEVQPSRSTKKRSDEQAMSKQF